MKNLIFILSIVLMVSCSKDEPVDPVDNPDSNTIEINYFDWNPDTLIVDSMIVDMDGDGVADVKFLIEKNYQGTSPSGGPYYNYFARCTAINSQVSLSLGTEVNPSQQAWDCLYFSDLISDSLTWKNAFYLKGQVIAAGAIGIWDTNDHGGYIATRHESEGSTKFGWIKVDVNYNTLLDKRYEIVCFEYAVSETNDATITAGQTE